MIDSGEISGSRESPTTRMLIMLSGCGTIPPVHQNLYTLSSSKQDVSFACTRSAYATMLTSGKQQRQSVSRDLAGDLGRQNGFKLPETDLT